MLGEDPFVVPNRGVGFSAWKYAKRRCAQICLLLVVYFPFSLAACPRQSADTERIQQTDLERSAEPGVPPESLKKTGVTLVRQPESG